MTVGGQASASNLLIAPFLPRLLIVASVYRVRLLTCRNNGGSMVNFLLMIMPCPIATLRNCPA